MTFIERNGDTNAKRVVITDGGIFDNLGVSCMEPNRSAAFGYNMYTPKRIICCSAGAGLFSDHTIPYAWPSRMIRSFESVFRKTNESTYQRLHEFNEHGDIDGFILAYLGQRDERLPVTIPDLVPRESVVGYLTDFYAMDEDSRRRLTSRGEQLTRTLVEHYWG